MKESEKMPSTSMDPVLLFSVLFLVGLGIVMIYSASSILALKKFGDSYFFVKKQAIFAIAGILLLVFFSHFPYRLFSHAAYFLLFISLLLILATYIPDIGISAGGAKRWVRIFNINFQPSELAKFSLVVYLAYSINRKCDKISDFMIGLTPHVLVLVILSLPILFQPDFGSCAILGGITWIMVFAGGARITHLLSGIIAFSPFAYLFIVNEPYRMRRLTSFLDPWRFPTDEGYQIVHSLMAFGSGGIWGAGIGNGHQKLFYLPEPHTDFIFSVIGEELGLTGVAGIIILFGIVIFKGIQIARSARERFGALLAFGLTVNIALHAMINIGVSLGVLPTKGLTLPFLSYGGTSLLISMSSIGILMNIGLSSKKPGKAVAGR